MLVSRARLDSSGPGLGRRRLAVHAPARDVLPSDHRSEPRRPRELRREEARRSRCPTAKYDVLAGEKIVGANEVVGREQNEKLRALHDAVDSDRGAQRGSRRVVGSMLFDFLLIALLGLTIVVFRPADLRRISVGC